MATQTVALLGATGGAGTTRLAVECGATLARSGREVAVLDAAFGTQGLADYVAGPIGTDLTAVLTEEAQLTDALYDCRLDVPGRLVLCPARAPFERLSRAKTAGAAERFEKQIAAAALSHDAVVVDTPPLATNQAVASVDAADRVAVVAPDTGRGADALARTRGRLADIGFGVDAVVANDAGDEAAIAEADARIPHAGTTVPADCPASVPPDGSFAPAVARATEAAVGVSLDLEFPTDGPLDGLLDT
jgi:MinD-like ATPase involved in chromosome partitioning or flagellar assembly